MNLKQNLLRKHFIPASKALVLVSASKRGWCRRAWLTSLCFFFLASAFLRLWFLVDLKDGQFSKQCITIQKNWEITDQWWASRQNEKAETPWLLIIFVHWQICLSRKIKDASDTLIALITKYFRLNVSYKMLIYTMANSCML